MGFFEVPSWDVGEVVPEPAKKRIKEKKKGESCEVVKDYSVERKVCPPPPSKPVTKVQQKDKHPASQYVGETTSKKREVKDHEPFAPLSKKSKAEIKLSGARFRYLNQKLYESSSDEAFRHFKSNPDDFSRYHEGFREQTKAWPVNPVDILIDCLKQMEPNVGGKKEVVKVVDMGCGDAKIGQVFSDKKSKKWIDLKSFDLVATNEHVRVANMTSVPLSDSSIDVVIFCLSLMNKDHLLAIREAHRILKPKGVMWIAEVSSRLEGGGSQGIKKFENLLRLSGFVVTSTDTSNSVFFIMYAQKIEQTKTNVSSESVLRPCYYKKR